MTTAQPTVALQQFFRLPRQRGRHRRPAASRLRRVARAGVLSFALVTFALGLMGWAAVLTVIL